jgi:hypothetical protein
VVVVADGDAVGVVVWEGPGDDDHGVVPLHERRPPT